MSPSTPPTPPTSSRPTGPTGPSGGPTGPTGGPHPSTPSVSPAPSASPAGARPPGRATGRTARRTGTPALLAAALGATAAVSPFAAAPAEAAAMPAPQAGPLSAPTTAALTAAVLSAAPSSAGSYRVRAGDTLSGIAVRTGTSVAALVAANSLASADLLITGQMITVPAPGAAAAAAPREPEVVTVAAGDTLSGIALRTGSTVAELVSFNGLRSADLLVVGQEIAVPAPGTASTASTGAGAGTGAGSSTGSTGGTGATVTVVPGDTLGGIAARAGVPLSRLLASSGLDAATPIRPGQEIFLPADAQERTPVASSFAGRTYAPEVTAAATNNRDALVARETPSTAEVREIIERTALEMGVDPSLALAIGYQESGFDATAVSPANALGAMQVIPSSGRWASQLVGRDLDLLDPEDNAVAGVAILRALLASADDLPMAIAGYYQGLAGVRANGLYDDTRRYVANIQTLMTRFA